jgi:hypothetical protein
VQWENFQRGGLFGKKAQNISSKKQAGGLSLPEFPNSPKPHVRQ